MDQLPDWVDWRVAIFWVAHREWPLYRDGFWAIHEHEHASQLQRREWEPELVRRLAAGELVARGRRRLIADFSDYTDIPASFWTDAQRSLRPVGFESAGGPATWCSVVLSRDHLERIWPTEPASPRTEFNAVTSSISLTGGVGAGRHGQRGSAENEQRAGLRRSQVKSASAALSAEIPGWAALAMKTRCDDVRRRLNVTAETTGFSDKSLAKVLRALHQAPRQ